MLEEILQEAEEARKQVKAHLVEISQQADAARQTVTELVTLRDQLAQELKTQREHADKVAEEITLVWQAMRDDAKKELALVVAGATEAADAPRRLLTGEALRFEPGANADIARAIELTLGVCGHSLDANQELRRLVTELRDGKPLPPIESSTDPAPV